ncbi:hypothetical protein G7Y79_00055g089820 [Physcia stellaris]|nr:hypothetical protein G7Y79_00055g089820 [Physcia stellaris]
MDDEAYFSDSDVPCLSIEAQMAMPSKEHINYQLVLLREGMAAKMEMSHDHPPEWIAEVGPEIDEAIRECMDIIKNDPLFLAISLKGEVRPPISTLWEDLETTEKAWGGIPSEDVKIKIGVLLKVLKGAKVD